MKNLISILHQTVAAPRKEEVSAGADFQKGLTAAQSGDFATALRAWKPLAEQGNADAQFNLGTMYNDGDGVPQDHKTAIKWSTLSTSGVQISHDR